MINHDIHVFIDKRQSRDQGDSSRRNFSIDRSREPRRCRRAICIYILCNRRRDEGNGSENVSANLETAIFDEIPLGSLIRESGINITAVDRAMRTGETRGSRSIRVILPWPATRYSA